ncbi:MAG TPA: glycosyltransferase family 4 protein [Chitinophagaceae bacterium]|nr:glycosyltransferase family 4 protein [Chitinophagaceae bacterium]
MKLVFTSYGGSPEYNKPEAWLKRIEAYTGILQSLSYDHTVIGIERINYEGEYEQQGVYYFFIHLRRKKVRFPFRMHRLIKRLKPDVVFINGFIFPLQIIQLRLKLGGAVKIIVLNQAEKPFKGIKRYLQRLADKCVDAYLFASSEFGEQWTRNGNIIEKKKIREVLHASSIFRPGNKDTAKSTLSITGSPIFLYVGRLDANKDPITVVKAFINFLSFQPLAKLYMIYHTEDILNEVKKLICQDEKAMQAINLIGKIKHEQLQAWYDSADFIVSGSHYEGGGIAVCEAMSCGCIPLLTDIISFRRMTGPGKCGLLYEPGNADDLLSTLLRINEMNIEAERKKTLEQFKEELSFEAIARKITEVINSLKSTNA